MQLKLCCVRHRGGFEKKEALPEIGAPVLWHTDEDEKKSVPEKINFKYLSTLNALFSIDQVLLRTFNA